MVYLTVIAGLELVVLVGCFMVLLDAYGRAEAAWSKERADLLQRIQAPQIAVMDHQSQMIGPVPLHVPFDDDEEFQASKEELAEQGWKDELSGAR